MLLLMALTALLLVRFIRSGCLPMLKMMGGSPESGPEGGEDPCPEDADASSDPPTVPEPANARCRTAQQRSGHFDLYPHVRVGSTPMEHMQIGDVAERTGLSLRTIRHYEEVGLLPEAQRSAGGFRLYTEDAVGRLLLIKRMKPLDFSLEEMRDLIEVRDRLASPRLSAKTRADLLERLSTYQSLVEHQLDALRDKVDNAQAFADQLLDELS